jgi:hypothetical protein
MKSIKAKLSKFATVDEYIHGWGAYYYGAGILIPTRKVQDPGTIVALHIEIATGEPVLRGEGVVEEIRTDASGATVGLVVRFTRLDARSKELTQQILANKREAREESASVSAAPSGPSEEVAPHATAEDLGALAEAFDETFDKIFATGSFGALADSEDAAGQATTAESEACVSPAATGSGPVATAESGPVATAESGAGPARATKAVTQALAGLGITLPEDEEEAAETRTGTPSNPEARVRDYISGAVEAASGAHRAVEDSPARSIDAAAQAAARAAAEGEAALDQLIGDAPKSDSMSANLVPAAPKRGLFARFFAWLGRLFGGRS